MNLKIAPKIWFDGRFINWQKAKVSILSQSLQRGSAIFESMAFYKTKNGPAIFRLRDHVSRFFESARLTKMKLPLSKKDFTEAVVQTVRASKFREGSIRPLAFYQEPAAWLTPDKDRAAVAVAVFQASPSPRLGRCKIISFKKPANPIVKAKVAANYMLGRLAEIEALTGGFNESVFFNEAGKLLEGAAANIFIIKNRIILTPPVEEILTGMTRDSVIKIAKSLDYQVKEKTIKKRELLLADEVFMTSTSIKVLPMKKVDRKVINQGRPGPITKILQKAFDEIVHGRNKKYREWLTFVWNAKKSKI